MWYDDILVYSSLKVLSLSRWTGLPMNLQSTQLMRCLQRLKVWVLELAVKAALLASPLT